MPPERVRRLNHRPERAPGEYVLYWIQMAQRAGQSWALTAAVEAANRLRLPLLAYQGLGCTYPFANDRIHRFILEGVAELGARFARRGIRYHFYLRRRPEDPNDVLYRLARRAALVVTDDFPAFFLPEQTARVAGRLDVALWAVDGNGIVPLACLPGEQYGAAALRPRILRLLPGHLRPIPEPQVRRDAPALQVDAPETLVTPGTLEALLASCAIDHAVPPSPVYRGGRREARRRLRHFVTGPLRGYTTARHEPGSEATSRLSPYLHFGQIGLNQVALAAREAAAPAEDREAFLDQCIVRRELAFNFCRFNPHHRSLEALPAWARRTLAQHARDPRPYRYPPAAFEAAQTHDRLWNAVQTELLVTGLMVGYYRMYWGKKILEWSETPEAAQATMIALHEKYALDGRDPNTYSNILWCFGKHDRPWPERPVYGTVRSMTLAGMERKTDVAGYLERVDRWCALAHPAGGTMNRQGAKAAREGSFMPRVDWSYHRPG